MEKMSKENHAHMRTESLLAAKSVSDQRTTAEILVSINESSRTALKNIGPDPDKSCSNNFLPATGNFYAPHLKRKAKHRN